MVKTASTMLDLGTLAPDFCLPNPDGKEFCFADIRGPQGTLVMFICNHCPYVVHVRPKLVELSRHWMQQGIGVVAINSNDYQRYPDDRPERMAEDAKDFEFSFQYLIDEDQSVAQAYKAACTPDFYLFDQHQKLVYRGQLDDSRPSSGAEVTGKDLDTAVRFIVEGKEPQAEQRPSLGCNIKWKPGNQPHYFRG